MLDWIKHEADAIARSMCCGNGCILREAKTLNVALRCVTKILTEMSNFNRKQKREYLM